MGQAFDVEIGMVEIARLGPEADPGAGVAPPHGADLFEIGALFALGEGHVPLVAVAPHPHLQTPRQRIDHRHPHAVEAAREAVVLVGELAAGVEPGEDHLHPGDALLGVDVHGHAATVVFHFQGTVIVEDHPQPAGMAGDGLVHGVVDHLLGEMVGAGGVGVHPRALAHRVEARQHLDG